MTDERTLRKRAAQSRYRKSAKGRKTQRRWRQTPKGRAAEMGWYRQREAARIEHEDPEWAAYLRGEIALEDLTPLEPLPLLPGETRPTREEIERKLAELNADLSCGIPRALWDESIPLTAENVRREHARLTQAQGGGLLGGGALPTLLT